MVPVPAADVFQPANVYPDFTRLPEFAETENATAVV